LKELVVSAKLAFYIVPTMISIPLKTEELIVEARVPEITLVPEL